MVETLGITVDRRPKGRPRKRENCEDPYIP